MALTLDAKTPDSVIRYAWSPALADGDGLETALKLLAAPDPRRAVVAMREAGVLAQVLPEASGIGAALEPPLGQLLGL